MHYDIPHSAGVDSANSMQKIVVSSPVYTFLNAYMMDCTRMYAYVLVYTSMYIHDDVILQFMQVHTGIWAELSYVVSWHSMY